jgi:sporulation protein YlmC with PRC-barrel domain
MDIPINVEVRCTDEPCGKSNCVILNPITDQITHIVVQGSSFPYLKRLVPVDKIKQTTPDMIQLKCDLYEYVTMPEFIQEEFIIPDPYGKNQEIPTTMLLPYAMVMGTVTIEHEHIPPDELAIHRGTPVIAIDGRVGQVDEFLIEPKSGHITHLVLREGHLWGKKDVSIPVSKIDRIDKDSVYLKIGKQEVEALTTLPIHRSGWR